MTRVQIGVQRFEDLRILSQRQFLEDSSLGGLVLSRALKPAQLLVEPFCILKQMDEIEPDFPHPLCGSSHLSIEFLIRLVEVSHEGLQFLPGSPAAASELSKQGGVRHRAAADHHGVLCWEFCLEVPDLRHRSQITVITNRVFAPFQSLCESLHMELSSVLFLLHSGMDGQAGNWIAVIDFQQPVKLLLICDTKPGLDGHRHLHPGKYLIKKAVQIIRLCQKAGALSLRRDCS